MFYFGVDYYPEQWPEERWAVDADLMQAAGLNVVRLAEFGWSRMEPEEGRYEFDWLDRAIQILSERGIQVILGTPTASPPAWLMSQSPDLFRVQDDGLRATYGNRREYCPNHPHYHEVSRRIVLQMAEHYARHASVIGWQIDNEFGQRCYCPVCQEAFQTWLRRRYSSLDTLNQKWGTTFWSHAYSNWSQIPLPLKTGGSPNPGLALDFARFASDSYVAFQKMQVDILRQKCPGHFVTHNFMGFDFDQIDYFELAKDLDFVSLNHYPRDQWKFRAAVNPSRVALQHDTMRGLKQRNYWMMEQQAGSGGWEILSVAPRPGELRLWAYQSIAHGADGILFFRWRTARYGTEQLWNGLLDYDARPTRRYGEIHKMGAELRKIGERLIGSTLKPEAAILLSYDSRFAFQIQPNHPRFSYPAHLHQVYDAFYRQHIPVDVIAPGTDLSAYKLVVAPALHVLTDSTAREMESFVKNGGVLLLTQRSGVKDEANAVVDRPLPGLVAGLAGAIVEEVDSLADGMSNSLEFCLPQLGSVQPEVGILCEVLRPTGAGVVATYTRDYYAGRPAITQNRFGKGQVVYVGAVGGEELYGPLAAWLSQLAGIHPLFQAPAGVEVSERWQQDRRYLFVLNHTDLAQKIPLDGQYTNLLDGGSRLQGTLTLPPNDLAILTAADEYPY